MGRQAGIEAVWGVDAPWMDYRFLKTDAGLFRGKPLFDYLANSYAKEETARRINQHEQELQYGPLSDADADWLAEQYEKQRPVPNRLEAEIAQLEAGGDQEQADKLRRGLEHHRRKKAEAEQADEA